MSRAGKILIYGATGYTGKLTARAAKLQGLTPILAGRSVDKVKPLADELGLAWRAFYLNETLPGLAESRLQSLQGAVREV